MLIDVYNGLHIEFISKNYAALSAAVHGEANTKPILRRENIFFWCIDNVSVASLENKIAEITSNDVQNIDRDLVNSLVNESKKIMTGAAIANNMMRHSLGWEHYCKQNENALAQCWLQNLAER